MKCEVNINSDISTEEGISFNGATIIITFYTYFDLNNAINAEDSNVYTNIKNFLNNYNYDSHQIDKMFKIEGLSDEYVFFSLPQGHSGN